MPGSTSDATGSTSVDGSTSEAGSTGAASSSSSDGGGDETTSEPEPECIPFPSQVMPVDADVVVAIDDGVVVDWQKLSETLQRWAMNSVNFAVLLPPEVPELLDFTPSCAQACASCEDEMDQVFVPYQGAVTGAAQALQATDAFNCMYRVAPGNGNANAPTRHVWFITDAPAQELPPLPEAFAGSRFHVTCPSCRDGALEDTELGQLVEGTVGSVGNLDTLDEQGEFIAAKRAACTWPYAPFDADAVPLVALGNESLNGGILAFPVDEGSDCEDLFNSADDLEDYDGQFFFRVQDGQAFATLCPEMCFLAQLDPLDATELFDQVCTSEVLE